MIGIPWRLAFALQQDGWILRNDIVWHKPNAMPESVTDRLATRCEHVPVDRPGGKSALMPLECFLGDGLDADPFDAGGRPGEILVDE